MGTVTRSALLKSLERAIDRADIHARSAIQHKETYERAKARDHKGDRAIAANNLWRHREALRWSREFLADAKTIRADLAAMNADTDLFGAPKEARAEPLDDYESKIMAGESDENSWGRQEREALAAPLTVPRSEPRNAWTPSITDEEEAALIQADTRKPVQEIYLSQAYTLTPGFNRFGDQYWNTRLDNLHIGKDTIQEARKAIRWHIDADREHEERKNPAPNLFTERHAQADEIHEAQAAARAKRFKDHTRKDGVRITEDLDDRSKEAKGEYRSIKWRASWDAISRRWALTILFPGQDERAGSPDASLDVMIRAARWRIDSKLPNEDRKGQLALF